jgi:hypothetical protein
VEGTLLSPLGPREQVETLLQDAGNGVEKELCGLCGWMPCEKLRGC